jgi:hypothetical protein
MIKVRKFGKDRKGVIFRKLEASASSAFHTFEHTNHPSHLLTLNQHDLTYHCACLPVARVKKPTLQPYTQAYKTPKLYNAFQEIGILCVPCVAHFRICKTIPLISSRRTSTSQHILCACLLAFAKRSGEARPVGRVKQTIAPALHAGPQDPTPMPCSSGSWRFRPGLRSSQQNNSLRHLS